MFKALFVRQAYDVNNPDWLPTLYLGHDKSKNKTPVGLVKERYERMSSRKKEIAAREKAVSLEAAIREEAATKEETSTREEAVVVYIVLADRGFDITESVGAMQASLNILAFTKGKSQLFWR